MEQFWNCLLLSQQTEYCIEELRLLYNFSLTHADFPENANKNVHRRLDPLCVWRPKYDCNAKQLYLHSRSWRHTWFRILYVHLVFALKTCEIKIRENILFLLSSMRCQEMKQFKMAQRAILIWINISILIGFPTRPGSTSSTICMRYYNHTNEFSGL